MWGVCAGCPPSLTIFSAAVLLMKRDPCPGLPAHFTFIPAAAEGERGVEQKAWGGTGAPALAEPGMGQGHQLLTPRALFTIEDAEGVGWAGQACSGYIGGVSRARGCHGVAPSALSWQHFPLQAGTLWVTAVGKEPPRESLEATQGVSAQGVMPTGRGVRAERRHVPVPALPPLTLIQSEAHIECFELGSLHEHLHALVSTHLLICREEPGVEAGTRVSPSPPPLVLLPCQPGCHQDTRCPQIQKPLQP